MAVISGITWPRIYGAWESKYSSFFVRETSHNSKINWRENETAEDVRLLMPGKFKASRIYLNPVHATTKKLRARRYFTEKEVTVYLLPGARTSSRYLIENGRQSSTHRTIDLVIFWWNISLSRYDAV